VLNIIDKR